MFCFFIQCSPASCPRDVAVDLTYSEDLFTWRWVTPGRWGNLLRWGNPPVHILSFYFDYVFMIGWVTTWEIIWTGGILHLTGLPHLPGVPYLHVNRSIGMHFRGFISLWQRTDRKTCRRRRLCICCRCCWLLLGSALSSSSLTFLGNCGTP